MSTNSKKNIQLYLWLVFTSTTLRVFIFQDWLNSVRTIDTYRRIFGCVVQFLDWLTTPQFSGINLIEAPRQLEIGLDILFFFFTYYSIL